MPPARASRTGESAAVPGWWDEAAFLVDRGPELRAASPACGRPEGAAGKPGLAPVMGDAGIGKTRLVDALVAELGEQGPLVLSGHCSMGWPAQEVPLTPVVDALRQLRSGIGFDAFRRLVDPGTTAMTALLPSWRAGRSSRRIPSAPSRPWRRCMPPWWMSGAAARRRPVLLVIEDAHWADQSSRDLVDYVLRSVCDERLAVLVTFRTDDPAFVDVAGFVANMTAMPHASTVAVASLTSAEVVQQVAHLHGGAELGGSMRGRHRGSVAGRPDGGRAGLGVCTLAGRLRRSAGRGCRRRGPGPVGANGLVSARAVARGGRVPADAAGAPSCTVDGAS
jgi:hypothetical protein